MSAGCKQRATLQVLGDSLDFQNENETSDGQNLGPLKRHNSQKNAVLSPKNRLPAVTQFVLLNKQSKTVTSSGDAANVAGYNHIFHLLSSFIRFPFCEDSLSAHLVAT